MAEMNPLRSMVRGLQTRVRDSLQGLALTIKDKVRNFHVGAGHAQAWFRAGFKELAQILVAFPDHSVQPVEEPGLVGNPTNIEVLRGKEADPVQLARDRAREAGRERDLGQERSF